LSLRLRLHLAPDPTHPLNSPPFLSNYDPAAPKQPFLPTFLYLNQEMVRANARIDQRHNWDSVWWEWPLNLRGVLYYGPIDLEGDGLQTLVYLLGNPGVIWPVGIAVILSACLALVYLRQRTQAAFNYAGHGAFWARIAWCQATFVLNLLPYVLVVRSCFIYHYMPALMYGEILTALLVDKVRRWVERGGEGSSCHCLARQLHSAHTFANLYAYPPFQLAGPRRMPLACKLLLGVVVLTWLHFAPWVYGIREWKVVLR